MNQIALHTVAEAALHQTVQGAAAHGGGEGSAGEAAMAFFRVDLFGRMIHLDTIVYSVGITVLLTLVAIIAGRRMRIIPVPVQSLFEVIYFWLAGLAEDMIGKTGRNYVPFVMTIFLFILCANWIAMIPGFIPPSRDINTTLAYALISFMSFTYFGMVKAFADVKKDKNNVGAHCNVPLLIVRGLWKWFSHYFEPVPSLWKELDGVMKYVLCPVLLILFFFLNVIEELARVLSLSIRLMGNIMGEHLALAVFFGLVVAAGQLTVVLALTKFLVWFSSAFVVILGALSGFIQAMIFSVLTLSYISHAVAEEH